MGSAQANSLATASQRIAHQQRPALELPTYGLPPEAVAPDSLVNHSVDVPVTGSPASPGSLILSECWRTLPLRLLNCQLVMGQPMGSRATAQRCLLRVALSPQAP